jgi:hypothetical protein
MTIRENIQDVIDQITLERNTMGGQSPTADGLQRDAIAAIPSGQGMVATGQITEQWRTYMTNFAGKPITNPAQLARLLPTDGSNDADRQKERAYLVANGMCGVTTTDDLTNGTVTELLDQP